MTTPYPEPQLDPMSSPEGSTTGLLEREHVEQEVEPGDHERFAHYVRKEKVLESALSGEPVVACAGRSGCPGATRRSSRCAPCARRSTKVCSTAGATTRAASNP